MPVDLELLNLSGIISVVLAIVSIIITLYPAIVKFWNKISKTILYKKIESKTSLYYTWGDKRKFLIIGIMLLIIGISIFSISIYQIIYPSPTVQTVTVYPYDFIDEGRGGLFDINSDSKIMFLKIDKAQGFMWKRGWSENNKLKRIKIDYTTSGTQINIVLGSNLTPYSLGATAGISTLEVDNFLIPYEENKKYYMSIINSGDNSFNLLDIKVEEEVSKPQDSSVILFLFSYILMIFSIRLIMKHKNMRKEDTRIPLDLLRKEAAYADRIENVEMELEVHQNILHDLEELNLKGDVSTNFYQIKKKHYGENINKLIDEKKRVILEIEGILKHFERK